MIIREIFRDCRVKTGRTERKQGKKIRPAKWAARAIVIFCAAIFCIMLVLGVILFFLYKSGKSSLYGKAEYSAPVVDAEPDFSAAGGIERFGAVQWQSDWIAAGGKVYEYNRDTINILILGIDRAGGLERDTNYDSWDAGQADAIFIVSLNPVDKEIKVVGIPRNSMVWLNIYGSDGEIREQIYNQICLQYGYAGGGKNGLAEMARAASELLYQLPIHGVAAIGYDAIVTINDAVGGVEVEILEDIIYDPEMVKGNTIRLTGEQAFLYLHHRDVTRAGSPTERLMRQKQYLFAFADTAKTRVKENPLIVSDVYRALAGYMNTDITLDQAVYMATEILDYHFDIDEIYTLEGEDKIVPYLNEEGQEDFYDDYYLNEDSIKEVMAKVFYTEVHLTETDY